ncbi:MAG: hypothetical protein ABI867_15555 [Kofleriaceae bacterium]
MLVVDPYAMGRVSLSAAIMELGYHVVAVGTAHEGRTILELGAIDVIVADADNAAIRRLITDLQASGVSIPTVMLTTQHHRETIPNTALLEKPTSLDALSTAITASLIGSASAAA